MTDKTVSACKKCNGKGYYTIAVSNPSLPSPDTTTVPCDCKIRGNYPPTAEKKPHWKWEFEEKFVDYVQTTKDDGEFRIKGEVQELYNFIRITIDSSVQEAKAERDREIENLVADYEDVLVERLKKDPMSKGRERYFAEEIISNIDGFFDWLASLKQEEGK